MENKGSFGKLGENIAALLRELNGELEEPSVQGELVLEEKHPGNEQDGRIGWAHDHLLIVPPKNNKGRWPLICPSDNVVIRCNGKVVTEPTVVTSAESISIEPERINPASTFQLEVQSDQIAVLLHTSFSPGRTYQIESAQPTSALSLSTFESIITPEPIEIGDVLTQIAELGVCVGVDQVAIECACYLLEDSTIVAAQGRAVVPPVDGWVEYMFKGDERTLPEFSESDTIDFFDKGDINSVEQGEILAVVHPPTPGRPGLNVFGAAVLPPPPKSAKLVVGQGVEYIEERKVAVATMAGRPAFHGREKRLCITSELIIAGDVDISTGHIRFKGNVTICGSILEGLTVDAGGRVVVKGNVFQGTVCGATGVFIKGNAVGAKITAGGEGAKYRQILPEVTRLHDALLELTHTFAQLKENRRFSTNDLKLKGDGRLLKIIMDLRLPQIEKTLGKVMEMAPSSGEERKQGVWGILGRIADRLMGLNVLSIKSISEVERFVSVLDRLSGAFADNSETRGNVMLGYAQNSQVTATGSIKATGRAVYHCQFFAGDSITINGPCRGGEYHSVNAFSAQELGTSKGTLTKVEVDSSGIVTAQLVYSNVVIRIGNTQRKTDELVRRVQFSYGDELVARFF